MNVTQDIVLDLLDNSEDHLFVTGGAGTGKSYTVNQWLANQKKSEVAVCAPTGVAALNINGMTLHRAFNIPFNLVDIPYQAALGGRTMKAEKKMLVRQLKALLIDEISMVRSDVLTYIDLTLQEIRTNDEPFGGLRVICVGDPFQLPPVVLGPEKEKLRKPWFFQSDVWKTADVKTLNLTKGYRQKDDEVFANILNNIRRGVYTFDDLNTLNTRILPAKDKAMILGTTNRTVNARNEGELAKIAEEELSFEMDYENFVDDYKIQNFVPAPATLFLKVGARVMLLNNYAGWVNGSLGNVVDFSLGDKDPEKHHVIVKLDSGAEVKVHRYTWVAEEVTIKGENMTTKVLGEATQFPIKLGYAVTVHKSQGMTFPNMHFDLDYVFERGQTYVALSRATELEGLTLGRKLGGKHIIYDRDVKYFMKTT